MDSPGPPPVAGEESPVTSFILLERRDSLLSAGATPAAGIASPATLDSGRGLPPGVAVGASAAPRGGIFHGGSSRLLYALHRRNLTPTNNARDLEAAAAADVHYEQRPREDSISDLFPMNASVFTNPENIMPSRQDSILIDTDSHQQQLTPQQQNANTLVPAGSQFLGASAASTATIGSNSLSGYFAYPSTGSILQAVYEQSNKGNGATGNTNGSREPSFEGDFAFQDASGVAHSTATSRASASAGGYDKDDLGLGGGRKRRLCASVRWEPRAWLISLWERLTNNWDSIFQMCTLGLAICSVPIAAAIAWALDSGSHFRFSTRCELSRANSASRVSTAYIAAVLIPMMNYAVLLVVSLWVGVLCSRSRKRVLRSGPASISSNLSKCIHTILLSKCKQLIRCAQQNSVGVHAAVLRTYLVQHFVPLCHRAHSQLRELRSDIRPDALGKPSRG
jgi:hypothetical protein